MIVPDGYAFYNIFFQCFGIIACVIMLIRQIGVYNRDEKDRAFAVVLAAELIYFVTFILRVLVDTGILPAGSVTLLLSYMANIGVLSYMAYRIFIFLELYQGEKGFSLWKNHILYILPLLFNILLLFSTPFTGVYLKVEGLSVTTGSLFWLLVMVDCLYPVMGLLSFLTRHTDKLLEGRAGAIRITLAFPIIFMVSLLVSAAQWRIPAMTFGLLIADIIVTVYYSEVLRRQRDREIQDSRQKRAFLSDMGHEIRTAMNAINAYTDIAKKDMDEKERVSEDIEKISTKSSELLLLIEKVLDMSWREVGEKQIETDNSEAAVRLRDINSGSNDDVPDINVLLVDDIEINREIAKSVLLDAGFTVEEAGDGDVAVSMIKESEAGHFDAVLMDIRMPVMNGYEATKEIRALSDKEKARIPIVAMTANAFSDDVEAALSAGMNGHLAKPINKDELIASIRAVVKRNRRLYRRS